MKKVGLIMQVRSGSTRLPEKALKKLGDEPMAGFIISRLKSSEYSIIVATTSLQSDDRLVSYLKNNKIDYYRGDENDVLDRMYQAAILKGVEVVVRITGDNPFIDGDFVRQYVEEYLKIDTPNLFMSTSLSKSYPLGISMEVFSIDMLKEAHLKAHTKREREHVTPYFYENSQFQKVAISYHQVKYNYRLTVDTPEDFELATRLVNDFGAKDKSVEDLIKILDENPDLAAINSEIVQRKA